MRKLSLLGGAVALTILLAACGSPPPTTNTPEPGVDITRVHYMDDDTVVLSAGLGMVDTDYEAPPEIMSVTPLGNGVFVGPVVTMGSDFRLLFPAGADVPAATLSPATSFITLLTTECTTTSSNPAARVSEVFWFLFTAPAVVGFGPDGIVFGLTSSQAIDFGSGTEGLLNVPVVSWIYATAATEVSLAEAGCGAGSITAEVNLSLERGWNQVEVVIKPDPEDATENIWTLSNSDADELHVTFLSSGPL